MEVPEKERVKELERRTVNLKWNWRSSEKPRRTSRRSNGERELAFIDADAPPRPGMRHALLSSPRCANGWKFGEIPVLQMEVEAAEGGLEKAGDTEARKSRRCSRRTTGNRVSGLHAALARGGEQSGRGDRPPAHARAGVEPCQPRPWRVSLTEQGGQADNRGSGEPRFHRGKAPRQNGWRYYVHSLLGGMGLPCHGNRLRDPENYWVGDGQ